MKQLIMKDMKLIGISHLFILAMAIFGGCLGMFMDNVFMSSYSYGMTMIVSWFLVNTLIGTKELNLKSDALIVSLPIKKFDIVISKYITMLIYILGTLGIVYLTSNIVNALFNNLSGSPLGLTGSLVIGSIMIILMSLHIPFQYYAYKTAQFLPVIIQMLVIGFPNMMERFGMDVGSSDFIKKILTMDFKAIGFRLILISLILYLISSFISKGIYEAKEF